MEFKGAVKETLLFYVLMSSFHWTFSNSYSTLCTPLSLKGFLASSIMPQSPTCQLLSNATSYSLYFMNSSVTTSISWLLFRITSYQKNLLNA